MQEIFAFIFCAGAICEFLFSLLIKVDEYRCFKSEKIIDNYLKELDNTAKFYKRNKLSQCLFLAYGLILYIVGTMIKKINKHCCFNKIANFNSKEIIDCYKEESHSRFCESYKLSQYLFSICEVVGGNGWILVALFNNLTIQSSMNDKIIVFSAAIMTLVVFNTLVYYIKKIF